MNDSNSSSPSPRPTLKLKAGARKPPEQIKTQPAAQQSKANQLHSKASQKPGAQWSDEYKQRMQADMDALVR
jgi:hypothetical protein